MVEPTPCPPAANAETSRGIQLILLARGTQQAVAGAEQQRRRRAVLRMLRVVLGPHSLWRGRDRSVHRLRRHTLRRRVGRRQEAGRGRERVGGEMRWLLLLRQRWRWGVATAGGSGGGRPREPRPRGIVGRVRVGRLAGEARETRAGVRARYGGGGRRRRRLLLLRWRDEEMGRVGLLHYLLLVAGRARVVLPELGRVMMVVVLTVVRRRRRVVR